MRNALQAASLDAASLDVPRVLTLAHRPPRPVRRPGLQGER